MCSSIWVAPGIYIQATIFKNLFFQAFFLTKNPHPIYKLFWLVSVTIIHFILLERINNGLKPYENVHWFKLTKGISQIKVKLIWGYLIFILLCWVEFTYSSIWLNIKIWYIGNVVFWNSEFSKILQTWLDILNVPKNELKY